MVTTHDVANPPVCAHGALKHLASPKGTAQRCLSNPMSTEKADTLHRITLGHLDILVRRPSGYVFAQIYLRYPVTTIKCGLHVTRNGGIHIGINDTCKLAKVAKGVRRCPAHHFFLIFGCFR
jgi:hypothetical protein